jgi:hypothetical protein
MNKKLIYLCISNLINMRSNYLMNLKKMKKLKDHLRTNKRRWLFNNY